MNSVSKLAWLHFKVQLPSDWEPVAFSSNPKEGRLEFANRHGHLGRLAWMQCKEPPDIRKIMESFQKASLKTFDKELLKSFSGLSFKAAGAFSAGVHSEGRPYQAACYHQTIKTFSIWTFPSYGKRDFDEVVAPILESFRENLGEWREWAIWGMDFRLHESFTPINVQALPANVSISFESPRKHRVDMHRWGVPEAVLGNLSLQDFHRKLLRAGKFRIKDLSERKLKGFDASKAVISRRGEFDMDYLYGRAWQGDALCWLDTDAKRINAFEQVHSRKSPALEMSDVLPQLS